MAGAKKQSRAAAATKKAKKTAKKKATEPVKAKSGQAEKDHAERSARGSKGTKRVTRPAAPVPQARKMPSAKELRDLISDVQGFMDKAKSQNGKGRQLIAEAKKDIGLNKVAFSMVRKLIKVGTDEPNALMVLLEDFDHYRKVLKIDDLAGPSMFEARAGAEGGGEGDEGEGGDESDGETQIPQAAAGAADGDKVVPLH